MKSIIKPCLWCGHIPVKRTLPSGMEYYACVYPKCACNPNTNAYKAKGAALRAWNKRNSCEEVENEETD